MKIILSQTVSIQFSPGELSTALRRELISRYPIGAESGETFLQLGRCAANFVCNKLPTAEVIDNRPKLPIEKLVKPKWKTKKYDEKELLKNGGGFFFLTKNTWQRAVPNIIRNICIAAGEKCEVVNLGSCEVENWNKKLFQDSENYIGSYGRDGSYGIEFIIAENLSDLQLSTINCQLSIVIASPSRTNFEFAKKHSCDVGPVWYNNAKHSVLDYRAVATTFSKAVRRPESQNRTLKMKDTVFNMVEDFVRNEIITKTVLRTKKQSNLFLMKYISHAGPLIQKLALLNPIVYLPKEFSTQKHRDEVLAMASETQTTFSGLNFFVTYADAISLGKKLPSFDNAYFISPAAAAVQVKAARTVTCARREVEKLGSCKVAKSRISNIYDFVDVEIKELRKAGKVRRELFGRQSLCEVIATDRQYI